MARIYPSLISGDILNIRHELEQFDPICPGYHLDVMDFNFVPNLTWGPTFINAIATQTKRQLWVHLMVQKPDELLPRFKLPAQTMIDFHLENNVDTLKTISLITENNWLPGLAISPKTSVEKSFEFLKQVHQVTIMSVEPGFSGQSFIESSLTKIEQLAAYRTQHNLKFKIAVDGGITSNNIQHIITAGADIVAAAAAIFHAPHPVDAYKQLEAQATRVKK